MFRLVLYYVLLLALLSSGCVFGAVRFRRRFEDCLPIFLVGVSCFLFLFGLLGQLPLGFFALCAAALALYVLAGLGLRRDPAALRRVLTPAAGLFALVLAGLFYINYGHLPYRIDEMSQWANAARAMYDTGLLSCAPEAATILPTYPPGMALMEYALMKLYDLAAGRRVCAEWVMYVAYQSFLLSFFFPFFRTLDARRPLRALLTLGLVFLCPLMEEHSPAYSCLYIDVFMSVVFGCGLAQIFTLPEKDGWYACYLAACCVILVLVKPAGIVMAAFLAVCAVAECCLRAPSRAVRLRAGALAALCVLLPYGLWSLALRLYGVGGSYSSKEGAVDPALMLRLMLHREGESWQQLVHDEYYRRLFTDSLRIKGFDCPNWLFLLLSVLAVWLLARRLSRRHPALRSAQKLALPALALIVTVYYVSLCYTYIFKFDYWEAIVLAAMARYVDGMLYAVYFAALLCFVRALNDGPPRPALLAAALALFVLLSPFGRALEVARRTEPIASQQIYRNYRNLSAELSARSDRPVRVWLVSQGNPGGDFNAFRYCLRPHGTVGEREWHFGPSPGPQYGEDRYVAAEDWARQLREGYDYVYLFHIDDYFVEHYAAIFAPGSEPEGRCLYAVSPAGLTWAAQIAD